MDKFIYISPSEGEERLINSTELREVFRVGKTIGYAFKDGEISSAKMESEEEAMAAFKAIDL